MGGLYNAGADIVNAFIRGRQLKRQAERDLLARQVAQQRAEQDTAELSERKRQFDETIKRLNEQFKAEQKYKEAQFNKDLANLKIKTAGEFGKGTLKPTEYDTSESGVERFLGGETSPTVIKLSPNVSFDIREFGTPEEVQRVKARGIRTEEEARQEAREPFNLRSLVQKHRNAVDLQNKRDAASAERVSKQIAASGKRLDTSLAAALQRTREQIASHERIAALRVKNHNVDKDLDNAVLINDVREGRIQAENPVIRKLGYNKLFADNKVTPLSKKQFDAIEALGNARNVFEKFEKLAELANNYKLNQYDLMKTEAQAEISGIAEVLGKKLGVLSGAEQKRLEGLFPTVIVALRDKDVNVRRVENAVGIYNEMVKKVYANLPEEHRDYLVKKHNLYVSFGKPKTKYDLKMRGIIP